MPTLFQTLLGPAFDALPEPVRRFHTLEGDFFTGGRSTITRSRSRGAIALSWIAGLPSPGADVETTVRFTPFARTREYWRRDFSGRRYRSVMEAAKDGRLIEHFGPFDLYFDLTPGPHGLLWSLNEWRLLKLRLPRRSTPKIACFESAEGDDFTFDIDVVFPLVGKVVHYTGALRELAESRAHGVASRDASGAGALP